MPTPLINYPVAGAYIPASFEAWGPFSPDRFRHHVDPKNSAVGAVALRAAICKANGLDPTCKEAETLLEKLFRARTPPAITVRLTKFFNGAETGHADTAASFDNDDTTWYADQTAAMTTVGASPYTDGYRYAISTYIAGVAVGSAADNLKYLSIARRFNHPITVGDDASAPRTDSAREDGVEQAAGRAAGPPAGTGPIAFGFTFSPKPQVVRGACVATRIVTKTKEASLYGVFPAVAQFGAFQVIVPSLPISAGVRILAECVLLDRNGRVVDVESGLHSVLTYLS